MFGSIAGAAPAGAAADALQPGIQLFPLQHALAPLRFLTLSFI
jgi:hypothetical protein